MKKIQFKNSKKQTLRGFVHEPKTYSTAIIVLHGFPGHCNSDRIVKTCDALQKLGILALRFDFSGTDTSDGRFEDKLMSQEVKEIKNAIDFLAKNYKFKKLILWGHSTGAIDAALYAYKDKRINKLVLSGAVSKLNEAVRYDFTDEQVRDFWAKGYVVYPINKKYWVNGKKYWVDGKTLKKDFYDEFFTLSIPKVLKKYRRPLLIIHGTEDEAVPFNKDPEELYQLANKPKKLVYIKNADHSFTKPKHLKEAISLVYRFIK